jgi:hydrogenase maturation protease
VDPVRQIADAVLYEGYILWPYRRSALKNRQRWTFGGVYPRGHSAEHPDDRWTTRTQCLLEGGAELDVTLRFLHVVRRQVLDGAEPVDELVVEGERHLSWEEAIEREVTAHGPGRVAIRLAAGSERQELGAGAALERSWQGLQGELDVSSEQLGPGLSRITLRVANTTRFDAGSREQALERTFCSAHAVLRSDGEFVSMTDPPERLRAEAQECQNEGTWPVLVGDAHTMLASPIILEDHPRIAPESPGDLFDGGEIDQLLVLNILSLTDEEKAEMRATDPRAREILERTECLSDDELMALGGRWTGSSS